MHKQEEDAAIEVFGGNIIEAGMVKSILENAGIPSYLRDEIMGTYNPWFVSPGGAGAVKVIVSAADADGARELVHAFENNRSE